MLKILTRNVNVGGSKLFSADIYYGHRRDPSPVCVENGILSRFLDNLRFGAYYAHAQLSLPIEGVL